MDKKLEVWGVEELAATLRMSRSWVYKRVAERSIPHTRVGRSVRFFPHEIHAWLGGQAVGGKETA